MKTRTLDRLDNGAATAFALAIASAALGLVAVAAIGLFGLVLGLDATAAAHSTMNVALAAMVVLFALAAVLKAAHVKGGGR